MPVRRYQLLGFEDIMLLRGDLLEEGSLFWLLGRHADLLFPNGCSSGGADSQREDARRGLRGR